MSKKNDNIIDLRDMPLFFEDVSEESFIPVHGPKRLDGLSRPKDGAKQVKPKRGRKPWLLLLVLVPAAGLGWGAYSVAAHRLHPVTRTQPATKVAAAINPAPSQSAAASSAQVMYVAPGIGLKIYAAADFNAAVLENARVNTEVMVLRNVDDTWVYVQVDGFRGYTVKSLLWPTPVN